MGLKICSKCEEELPATTEYFYRDSANRDGLRSNCKDCANKPRKVWKERNREKMAEYNKTWRIKNKEKIIDYGKKYNKEKVFERRINKIKNNYGVSEEFIQNIMDIQKGCCAICGDSLLYPESLKNYCVDHEHTTGVVRGLLCDYCNKALGLMKDNKEAILRMAEYLEENTP